MEEIAACQADTDVLKVFADECQELKDAKLEVETLNNQLSRSMELSAKAKIKLESKRQKWMRETEKMEIDLKKSKKKLTRKLAGALKEIESQISLKRGVESELIKSKETGLKLQEQIAALKKSIPAKSGPIDNPGWLTKSPPFISGSSEDLRWMKKSSPAACPRWNPLITNVADDLKEKQRKVVEVAAKRDAREVRAVIMRNRQMLKD